jgi:hypothetical protein
VPRLNLKPLLYVLFVKKKLKSAYNFHNVVMEHVGNVLETGMQLEERQQKKIKPMNKIERRTALEEIPYALYAELR